MNVRLAAFSIFVLCLIQVGCVEHAPRKIIRSIAEENNDEASIISHQPNWKLKEKKVSIANGKPYLIQLKFELEKPAYYRNRQISSTEFKVYDTHRFFKEFNEIPEGSTTSFSHVTDMENGEGIAQYLAPNCPSVDAYYREHYDGGAF